MHARADVFVLQVHGCRSLTRSVLGPCPCRVCACVDGYAADAPHRAITRTALAKDYAVPAAVFFQDGRTALDIGFEEQEIECHPGFDKHSRICPRE